MKYAIISDVHGNLPALDLIINDAKSENVDAFIFAAIIF
jgi:predicted phosphodiesterase